MLMDGHAMVHRAWHAIQQPMTTRTGEEVRGVRGFASTFLKVIADWQPTHCAIAFDLPGPTFRHQQFQEYKAQRPEAPEELHLQFGRVRQLMEAFNVPIYGLERYEADDVLGTLSCRAGEQGIDTIILTGDTDTLQLVAPRVRVVLSYGIQEQKVFDENAVRERYGGLAPSQQTELKALKGDPSDNIPGVPGIGDKTAIKLIQQFGDIDELYRRIDEVASPKLQEVLKEHEAQARRGRELTTIVTDLPLNLDLEETRFGSYDRGKVLELFRELEFSGLVSRVPNPQEASRGEAAAAPDQVQEQAQPSYVTVDTGEKLEQMAEELRTAGEFSFDLETTGIDPMNVELVGLSFSTKENTGYYVPVGHRSGSQLSLGEVLERVKPLLEEPSLGKTAHNGNYDMTVLANYHVTPRNLEFDTMVAANLVGIKAIGLKALAFNRLNVEMTPIATLIGSGQKQRSMAEVPISEAAPYACADADMTLRLRRDLEGELRKEGLWGLFAEVEMPLVPVLVQMQVNGVALDTKLLRDMSRDLAEQLRSLEAEIYNNVGHQFNINSPSQLGDILFKELHLPSGKRTKTGYSTDAAVLEGLRSAHPVVDLILRYRELSKLKSTYVDALPGLINPRTGRVHTSYNQAGAATGRISSNDPNLQNVPIRTELGCHVRRAFIAQDAPEWTLLAADYSQIELRVLAHFSQDEALLAAFQRDEDIHAATASMVYNVPLDQITWEMRRIAKVMNFGVVYGLSAFGISQQTELTLEEGQQFIETYFGKYPGIRRYIEETKGKARDQGYVETLLGRRRYMPEMHAPNFQARQAAERMAINMPVQGTAADILKMAMIRLQEHLDRRELRTKMLLQVHDELVFEVPQEELETVRKLVLEVMPHALELSVPLMVELKTGATWGDME